MSGADLHAALLKPGSIDKLHEQLALAVARFAGSNAGADPGVLLSIVWTHILDLYLETIRAYGGAQEPGQFQAFIAAAAGKIERGEHKLGAWQ